jgi:hypothetical protein
MKIYKQTRETTPLFASAKVIHFCIITNEKLTLTIILQNLVGENTQFCTILIFLRFLQSSS